VVARSRLIMNSSSVGVRLLRDRYAKRSRKTTWKIFTSSRIFSKMSHSILIHLSSPATAIHHTVSVSSTKISASTLRGNIQRPFNEPNSVPEYTCRRSVSHQTMLTVITILRLVSARRYAPRIQELRHNPHPSITTFSSVSASLTDRNVLLHKSRHSCKPSIREPCETWLNGVVEAMHDNKLEHPAPAPWDLDSAPQQRIIDLGDRPEDEWNSIAYQRSVRRSGGQLRRHSLGNMSERYA
jgi:hypothetical protein